MTPRELFFATNAERIKAKVLPLQMDESLMDGASEWAGSMFTKGRLQHDRSAGFENIAWGQQTIDEVIRVWMNSPGHRQNILNRKHTKLGVGFCGKRNTDGSLSNIYWVQRFR